VTTTDLRWYVIAGWCLIRLNFYFGGQDTARVFEAGAKDESTVEEITAWRRQVEQSAAAIWAGFATFCRDELEVEPEEVVRATYPDLEMEIGMLRSVEPDWEEASKCRDEFVDLWRDLPEVD
jgi:hypothetical protein